MVSIAHVHDAQHFDIAIMHLYFDIEPYSFIQAADSAYCTLPPSIGSHNEALLLEVWDALVDRNPTTCLPLFAEGRTFFQATIDYHLSTTESLDVSLSGVGTRCENFVTVHFRGKCLHSRNEQCGLIGQSEDAATSHIQCVFRCQTLTSGKNDVRVTVMAQVPTWASDSHKLCSLCDFTLTRDWPPTGPFNCITFWYSNCCYFIFLRH